MTEHSKFSPSKLPRWNDCPGTHMKRVVFNHHQWREQQGEAQRIVTETHKQLIAEGYEWDGMDGYTKTEVKP